MCLVMLLVNSSETGRICVAGMKPRLVLAALAWNYRLQRSQLQQTLYVRGGASAARMTSSSLLRTMIIQDVIISEVEAQ